MAYKEVTKTFVNEFEELIHVNGEDIVTTPSHPFYVNQFGWTRAAQLRAGDVLVLSNGEYVVVEFIQHEILESPIKVYNFEVEDFHTYFVGESSVLVHNGCGDEDTNIVYRVIRDDEVPSNGLSAKNPNATYQVEGHVLNGSKPNFKSQYISTTTDYSVAQRYAAEDGRRIVKIDLSLLSDDAKIYDLSTDAGRAKYLKGRTSNNWARSSSEVLIEGYIPAEAIELILDQSSR